MEFRILGPLEVLDEGRLIPMPGGRARALLALLTLRAGQVVSAERLIDELWGDDPPPTATTALQGFVSTLRKRLEPARRPGEAPTILRTAGPGYLLDVDPGLVDAYRFKALLERARGEPIPDRATTLREALGLWRGPALVDVTFEAVGQREIARLEDLRLEALEERIEADLARGPAGELTAELEQLVAEHPVRERLRAQLMLALYRSDRQAEALEVYQDGRGILVEELGIEPGPGLRHLEQAILRQDVALDARPPPETAAGRLAADLETTPAPWLAGERRAVTALFFGCAISVVGDDGHAGLDVEAQRQTAVRALDIAAGVLRRHGAQVEELVGDELMALFGLPSAHENDALRGVRAAIELRGTLTALATEVARDRGEQLRFRAGIESGEVVVPSPGMTPARIFGVPIQRAARLQRGAPDGCVLIGEGTWWLVRGAAILEPRNDALAGEGLEATWRLVDVPEWASEGGRIGATFVGRGGEFARVRDAFDRSMARRSPYRFCVVGEPGIGKSRLASEFALSVGRQALVLTGRCPAYGEGISFWPLREIVQAAVGPRGRDGLGDIVRAEDDGEWIAAQVSAGTGLTAEAARADQLFPAVRRLFEVLAATRPLVVVLEDLHWAQPTFLDLVEYLGEWGRGPLLLLGVARPELLEDRPMWGLGGEDADTLYLEPLDREASERLIGDLSGGAFDPLARSQIVETARGNPLFVEQLVAASEDDGHRFVNSVPPSLGALLAARLDRLGGAERDILRSAAVVGTDFSIAAVAALVPKSARSLLEPNLAELARKQLISAGPTTTDFRFRHVLVQLAAYGSTTREDRARLHQRYADWLEREGGEQPVELDEILGYHLEQAVEHRRVLGTSDDGDASRAVRAGEYLARAGVGAFRRLDVTAAENLFSRALSLLPADHPDQRRIKPALSEARQILGRHEEADSVLAELQHDAAVDSDEILGRRIRVERARIQLIMGPDPIPLDVIFEEAATALEFFTSSGDDVGAAQACYVLVLGNLRRGRIREMERVARLSLFHAGRSGSTREEAASRWMVAIALNLGPSPVPDAIAECEELARWREAEHPGVLCELAHLRAMRGEFGEARELLARARRLMVEWMRARRPLMFAAQSSAAVELLASELAAAERELRVALQMAMDMKEREVASDCAARLARLLSGVGRPDEADAFATISADLSPAEDVVTQALWRIARAGVVAREGDRDMARGLALEALALVPAEMLNLRAHVLTNLADILREAWDAAGASAAQREAIGLYRRKGNLVATAHAASDG